MSWSRLEALVPTRRRTLSAPKRWYTSHSGAPAIQGHQHFRGTSQARAQATTAFPRSSQYMPEGAQRGVAAVGVVRAGAGTPGWQLPVAAAASLAGVAAVTAASLLLGLPCDRQPAETIAFDPAGVLDKLRAFAAGGLLLASVGYMLPAAAHFKPVVQSWWRRWAIIVD